MVRSDVRPPAVAGSFYPGDADELTAVVDRLLERARLQAAGGALGPPPVALVVPHAGYVYSGSVAASAYDLLRDRTVRRVAVLGPAHYVALTGIAVPAVAAFATPIGEVPVEVHTCAALADGQECVIIDDRPHRPEHSIEVQLPFLQRVLVPGGPVSRSWSARPHRSRLRTCWTHYASTVTCCRSSAPTCPITSICLPRSDAIGVRHRQSWIEMPPGSARMTRAERSPCVVCSTGRAGTSSSCGCCTRGPLPTLAEMRGEWSGMPRSHSCPRPGLSPRRPVAEPAICRCRWERR